MTIRLIFLLSITIAHHFTFAQQTIEKKFYKSRYGKEIKDEQKARFVQQTLIDESGIFHFEVIEIKSNKTLMSYHLKNGVPVGKWVVDNEHTLDYDLELTYIKNHYSNVDTVITYNHWIDGAVEGFQAPALRDTKLQNFAAYLSRNIIYPAPARENNIQGKVTVEFVIDEKGALTEIAILSGVDPILDKEVMRIFKSSGKWTPATRSGRPVKVAIIAPVSFKIAD